MVQVHLPAGEEEKEKQLRTLEIRFVALGWKYPVKHAVILNREESEMSQERISLDIITWPVSPAFPNSPRHGCICSQTTSGSQS